MKIQCDVCNKEEASVFCSADEAALCDGCDRRVHYANKLASKHHRFSLLHPSSQESPRCDVCQERRAFIFCQQDRAIFCRECDHPIHTANDLTQKHNRFLLSGVKLSTSSVLYTTTTTNSSTKNQPSIVKRKKPVSISHELFNPPKEKTTASEGGSTTSSISEYLIETLPGWHVEDLLDSTSPPLGFSKPDHGDLLPFLDGGDLESNLSGFSSKDLTMWVPQAPPSPTLFLPQYIPSIGGQSGYEELKEVINVKVNRKRSDDGFSVPQISPSLLSSKRSRSFW